MHFYRTALGLAFVLSVALVPQVEAHNRSQSHSTWNVSGNSVDMVFTVKAREVTRLSPLDAGILTLEALLTAHLEGTVAVSASNGDTCSIRGRPEALAAADGYLRVRASFDCQAGPASSIALDTFFAVAASHVHYARVYTDGELPGEYLYTESRREHAIVWAEGRTDSVYRGFLQYLVLGVEHILGGLDHLAFLSALLLLVSNFRELAWMVTGFTVGHSITLCLAVLGLVTLQSWVVEALIGFTIALVAADNIGVAIGRRGLIAGAIAAVLLVMGVLSAVLQIGLPLLTLTGLLLFTVAYTGYSDGPEDARRVRPALTLAFGLVHGFGFASVLNEIGLPEERLAAALAGFNIGVEIGQLAVVAALWWLSRWFARHANPEGYPYWLHAASAGLCGLGVFWFVSRGFAQV